MEIYKYVHWKSEEVMDIKKRLGKSKFKRLNEFYTTPTEGFTYGIVSLHYASEAEEFFELYKQVIEKKKNASVIDVIGKLTVRLQRGETVWMAYVRFKNVLIGGGVFICRIRNGKRVLVSAYRIGSDEYKVGGRSVASFVEFLYFKLAEELKVDIFSKGKDRNGYGYLGSDIGSPLHKLELNFRPTITQQLGKALQYVDVKLLSYEKISGDVLFFVYPDSSGMFQKALLISDEFTELPTKYTIIQKRGIDVQLVSKKVFLNEIVDVSNEE